MKDTTLSEFGIHTAEKLGDEITIFTLSPFKPTTPLEMLTEVKTVRNILDTMVNGIPNTSTKFHTCDKIQCTGFCPDELCAKMKVLETVEVLGVINLSNPTKLDMEIMETSWELTSCMKKIKDSKKEGELIRNITNAETAFKKLGIKIMAYAILRINL